ncbi:MAG: dual specificity protein phosphatase family protein [Microcoleus sp. SU_5_3]|nr:dual specificity protein phosphatase family protein [Microcoleus sp. SU_5_3]
MDAVRSWLLIGKYRDTLSRTYLQSQQIQALLTFAEPVEHPGIICRYLAVEDGVPLTTQVFETGLAFIDHHYRNNHHVLVACGAGISRSATFVIAALKQTEQLGLLEAARVVSQARPSILPHYVLWQSLCNYYHEDVPYLTLVRALQPKHGEQHLHT